MSKFIKHSIIIICLFFVFFWCSMYYIIHFDINDLFFKGWYVQKYSPLHLDSTYSVKYIKGEFRGVKQVFDDWYVNRFVHHLDVYFNGVDITYTGSIKGINFVQYNDETHKPDKILPFHMPELIFELERPVCCLGCPVSIEFDSDGKGVQFYCEVPLETMQFYISLLRGTIQGINSKGIDLELNNVRHDCNYTDTNILYMSHKYMVVLIIIILTSLYMCQAILPLKREVILIAYLIVITIFIVTFLLDSEVYNIIKTMDKQLYRFSSPVPFFDNIANVHLYDYKSKDFYGIRYICEQMDSFKCLRYPIDGRKYIVNPLGTYADTLHPFFKDRGLGRICGLVVFEGFPTYVYERRIMVKVPLRFMVELDYAIEREYNSKHDAYIRTKKPKPGFWDLIYGLLRFFRIK